MTIRRRDIAFGLILAVMFLTLCGLGIWQLKRAAWKTALINQINASEAAAPAVIGPDPKAQEWHRVVVSGVFLNDRALKLTGAIKDGKPGVRLIVPLERDNQPILLVDRGFVPMGETIITRDDAPVTITGRLRFPTEEPMLGPFSQPDLDLWYRVNPAVMAKYRDLDDVAPYFVEEAGKPGAASVLPPYPGYAAAELPNNHLQYAFTWFSLAACLVAMVGVHIYGKRIRQS